MGLFNTLIDTYNANVDAIHDFGGHPLIPVAHMVQNVQIEISIDINGNFISANEVNQDDIKTIIPVDEDSGSRSSGVSAHPYEDALPYVAGDYGNYVPEKEKALIAKKYNAYVAQLTNWDKSEYSSEKVHAVSKYVKKKKVMGDLIRCGLVTLKDGNLSDNKIAGAKYDKCLVRYKVIGTDPEESWLDTKLMEEFSQYYIHQIDTPTENKQVSMVTGELSAITYKHPKGTVSSDFGAKLMSANDTVNFTYRGRFENDREAYAVDYISSQKAHHALSCLIQNQGKVIGAELKRTFLIWSTSGKKIEGILDNIEDDDDDFYPTTEPEYKKIILDAIHGKSQKLTKTDKIAYITLHAATPGRLSVTYYGEMSSQEYLKRLEDWYTSCYWLGYKLGKDKKKKSVVVTPTIMQIVNCVYGRENSNGYLEVDEKLLVLQYQRLMHCVIDYEKIPFDMIKKILQVASNPLSYKPTSNNRERVLTTACALIHKYYCDKGRKIKMALDRNESDRNYLYGRLLAVYDRIESAANYHDADKEDRETNACRLQAAYAQHPSTVRKTIEEGLNSYLLKLKPGSREFYKHEIGQISNMIGIDKGNHSLNELYLVGYWAEREELHYSGNNTQKETNHEVSR